MIKETRVTVAPSDYTRWVDALGKSPVYRARDIKRDESTVGYPQEVTKRPGVVRENFRATRISFS